MYKPINQKQQLCKQNTITLRTLKQSKTYWSQQLWGQVQLSGGGSCPGQHRKVPSLAEKCWARRICPTQLLILLWIRLNWGRPAKIHLPIQALLLLLLLLQLLLPQNATVLVRLLLVNLTQARHRRRSLKGLLDLISWHCCYILLLLLRRERRWSRDLGVFKWRRGRDLCVLR